MTDRKLKGLYFPMNVSSKSGVTIEQHRYVGAWSGYVLVVKIRNFDKSPKRNFTFVSTLAD